jgi:hypothetical protein
MQRLRVHDRFEQLLLQALVRPTPAAVHDDMPRHTDGPQCEDTAAPNMEVASPSPEVDRLGPGCGGSRDPTPCPGGGKLAIQTVVGLGRSNYQASTSVMMGDGYVYAPLQC